jgi:hypothetical protein
MTPTEIAPTRDNQGTILTYRLDHALTDKGMGISLPQLPQPGETTRAVLHEIEDAWLFIFAILLLSLTLASIRHAVLLTIFFATATAFGYGLLADFSDLLFGFWGTVILILLPLFALLASLLKYTAPEIGKRLAVQFLLFGVVYPSVAGLDSNRQSLYLNLCALAFLSFTASLLVKRLANEKNPPQPQLAVNPAA